LALVREAFEWASGRPDVFAVALRQHLWLSGVSIGVASMTCIPLGWWIARRPGLSEPAIAVVNALRVVPSLAILFLAVPFLGIGTAPALVALTVLACPPLLINTLAAVRGLPVDVLEAATAMGMSRPQALLRVELPLALPVVVTGLRTAIVEVIASATLAAFIGGGGLGDFVTLGFALNEPAVMLGGAVPVAGLALVSEAGLGSIEWRLRQRV